MKEQRICLKYINNSQFQKFRKFKMLMRPPTIVDQNDNLSHLNSQSDARQSSKSKNKVKRKQTSLTMKNKNLYTAKDSESKQKQKEHDNGSVHSHASGRSKRSKKKQSSIGINKPRGAYMTLNSPRKSQQDEQIRVLSYEDINEESQNKNVVQYSQVKNDYLGSNLNKQVVNRFSNPRQNLRHNEQYSFKNVFQNSSDLIKNQSSKQSNEDQVPVVKLVEAKNQTYINPNMNSPYNNIISPKMVEKKETKRLGQLFEENRRLIQNQSTLGVSGIPSQVGNSAIGTESRRSRSKLGQLFKQKSKQKEISNSSKVQFSQNASSNYQSISQLHLNLESNVDGRTKKDGIHGLGNQKSKQKQNIGKNNIPQKVLEQSAYHFQGAQQINKSDLNLSLSRNSPAGTKVQYNKFGSQINNKDSVCFNIEPEREKKRKGLGLASRLNSQSDQLIKISGNLVSKQLNHQNSNQSAHERLKLNFYENEKYLIESGAFQSNESINQNDQFKKREDNNKKKQRQEEKDRLQKEKLERIRQEKERQAYRKKEQSRIQQEKIRKQQQKKRIQRIQRIRKEEENKKQEQRKLQQNLREEKRLKLQQQKKERQLEIERKKQRQIEEDKRKEKEIEMVKQLQRKRLIEQQQQMKAKIQRQRLKKAYNKQREQIRRSHQQSEKQKSIVQDLQNDSYHEDKMKKNKVKQNQLSRVPYSFSKQNSSKSQKSQESRKSTKKKQSVITKNKIKHYVGQISPRAEQSFYEQQRNDHKNKEQKFQQTIDQPRKLMSFSEQEDLSYEPKPEYKTDTYFYDKSLKAPSSKPPLSRKSSASKSKPKQGMITKKNTKDSQIKIKGPSGGNEKKLSLVQLAMRKNYEKGSQSENQSQDSFRSRQRSVESYGSRNSSGSKGSRKKESVIRLKENTYSGFNRPPLQRKNSSQNQDSLKYKTWKHTQQMEQQSRYSNANKITEVQSKIRVIKGCSFIDERGRLVENGNMMIKGNKVAGTTRNNQFTEKKMIERLMNSRQKRRSKSRQRSLNRSRTSDSIQKNSSKYSNNNSQTQKAFYQSQAYSESQGRYESSGSNFYGNTRNDHSYYREEGSKANYGNNGNSQYRNRAPQNLQQFMKPIEQAGVARVKNQTQNIYYERDRENNKKRTMQRTEKRM